MVCSVVTLPVNPIEIHKEQAEFGQNQWKTLKNQDSAKGDYRKQETSSLL